MVRRARHERGIGRDLAIPLIGRPKLRGYVKLCEHNRRANLARNICRGPMATLLTQQDFRERQARSETAGGDSASPFGSKERRLGTGAAMARHH